MGVSVCMSVLFFAADFYILKFGLALEQPLLSHNCFTLCGGSPATHLFSPIPEGLNTLKPRLWLWLFTLRLAFLWELSSQNTKKVAS